MAYVILPELGEGIETATVAFWHVKEGQAVSADQDVVEMVTDKATFNVASGHAGTVKGILAQVGEDIKIGQPLAVVE